MRDVRTLTETAEREQAPSAKALASYITLTSTTNALHTQYEVARGRPLVAEFHVAVLLVQHVPALNLGSAEPHVHIIVPGPRAITPYSTFGQPVAALSGDKGRDLVLARLATLVADNKGVSADLAWMLGEIGRVGLTHSLDRAPIAAALRVDREVIATLIATGEVPDPRSAINERAAAFVLNIVVRLEVRCGGDSIAIDSALDRPSPSSPVVRLPKRCSPPPTWPPSRPSATPPASCRCPR